jgi:hypothetical protein
VAGRRVRALAQGECTGRTQEGLTPGDTRMQIAIWIIIILIIAALIKYLLSDSGKK